MRDANSDFQKRQGKPVMFHLKSGVFITGILDDVYDEFLIRIGKACVISSTYWFFQAWVLLQIWDIDMYLPATGYLRLESLSGTTVLDLTGEGSQAAPH